MAVYAETWRQLQIQVRTLRFSESLQWFSPVTGPKLENQRTHTDVFFLTECREVKSATCNILPFCYRETNLNCVNIGQSADAVSRGWRHTPSSYVVIGASVFGSQVGCFV